MEDGRDPEGNGERDDQDRERERTSDGRREDGRGEVVLVEVEAGTSQHRPPYSPQFFNYVSTPRSAVSGDGGEEVARTRHLQDGSQSHRFARSETTVREHLNEIELLASRTRTAVETIENQLRQVTQDVASIRRSITGQSERMAGVESGIADCRRAVEAAAAETGGEIGRLRTTLEGRAEADAEREDRQEKIRVAVERAVEVLDGVKKVVGRLDEEAERSRSELWLGQLQDFLNAQKDVTHHKCTAERHSNECLELLLRPGGGVTGGEPGEEAGPVAGPSQPRNSTADGRRQPDMSPSDKRQKMGSDKTKEGQPSKQPVTCGKCGAGYSTRSSMQRHLTNGKCLREQVMESFQCGMCDYSTKYRSNLSSHIKNVHQSGKSSRGRQWNRRGVLWGVDTVATRPGTGTSGSTVESVGGSQPDMSGRRATRSTGFDVENVREDPTEDHPTEDAMDENIISDEEGVRSTQEEETEVEDHGPDDDDTSSSAPQA